MSAAMPRRRRRYGTCPSCSRDSLRRFVRRTGSSVASGSGRDAAAIVAATERSQSASETWPAHARTERASVTPADRDDDPLGAELLFAVQDGDLGRVEELLKTGYDRGRLQSHRAKPGTAHASTATTNSSAPARAYAEGSSAPTLNSVLLQTEAEARKRRTWPQHNSPCTSDLQAPTASVRRARIGSSPTSASTFGLRQQSKTQHSLVQKMD